MNDISPLAAHVFGYLTRQQFIEAKSRVEARRKEFLCQANAAASGDPVSREGALQSDASEDAK